VGVILRSLVMAAGLEGAAVVATDAVISIGIGLAKLATFGLAGVVTAQVIAAALLIGAVAFPGAFLAKRLVERLPLHVHTAILDAIVIGGGAAMMGHAFARGRMQLRPLRDGRQRRQDRPDIAGGAQSEDGPAVVGAVELPVAATAHELLLAAGGAPRRGEVVAPQLGIYAEEGPGRPLREGEVRLPVCAVE